MKLSDFTSFIKKYILELITQNPNQVETRTSLKISLGLLRYTLA
jgi:hypothetical protein